MNKLLISALALSLIPDLNQGYYCPSPPGDPPKQPVHGTKSLPGQGHRRNKKKQTRKGRRQ